MIDPPYGLGKEDWDTNPWAYKDFDLVFKKINAVDKRKNFFVLCFGTIPILADFIKVAKVSRILINIFLFYFTYFL